MIQIPFPNTKCVFDFLKLDVKNQIKVIELGLAAVDLIQETNIRYENSEFNEKLTEIEGKHEVIIKNIQEKLNQKSNDYTKLKDSHKNNEKELHENISNSLLLQFNEKIKEKDIAIQILKKENNDSRSELNKLAEKHFSEERLRTEEIHKIHQEKINTIRDNCEKKINDLHNKMCKTEENSSIKGKISEDAMLQNLNMLFPKNIIEDTHKESGRGDFIMTCHNDKKILLENKDYTNNVPKKEIDKFERDIASNTDVCAGIFMSNASGICKKEDFQIEMINSKPVIYLHHTNKDITKIKCAHDIIQAIIRTDVDFTNKELIDKLTQMSSEIKRKMLKCRKEIDKFSKNMIDTILDIENLTKKTYSEINIKY
tara:strand:+ start:1881 stop:2990 length:1110 start_codon:yes stop_codon:yes gene_type:complete